MRRDLKILDVMAKTRRQERETACCIRNDDSGCVQSSQADCSVRGLWPTVGNYFEYPFFFSFDELIYKLETILMFVME